MVEKQKNSVVLIRSYPKGGIVMKGNNKWGGKRAGAGRKKSLFERKGRTFRLTDAEFLEVKPLIDAVRRRTEEASLAATKGR